MSDVIRAEYKYNGFYVTCDPATVARMHALIRAELAVDVPAPGDDAVKFVSVHLPDPPRRPWGWREALYGSLVVVGGAFSLTPFVIGCVTIANWITG